MGRLTFKELLCRDIKTAFLNPEEFGELHTVNGKNMLAVIDNDGLSGMKGRANQHMDGIYSGRKLVYVQASNFGNLPTQGSKFVLDEKSYRIVDVVSEGGIYLITIEANRGR